VRKIVPTTVSVQKISVYVTLGGVASTVQLKNALTTATSTVTVSTEFASVFFLIKGLLVVYSSALNSAQATVSATQTAVNAIKDGQAMIVQLRNVIAKEMAHVILKQESVFANPDFSEIIVMSLPALITVLHMANAKTFNVSVTRGLKDSTAQFKAALKTVLMKEYA